MTEQIAWSLKTTATAMDMPYAKVHEAAKSGALKSYRLGTRYYVEPDDARSWLRSLAAGTTSPKED